MKCKYKKIVINFKKYFSLRTLLIFFLYITKEGEILGSLKRNTIFCYLYNSSDFYCKSKADLTNLLFIRELADITTKI